MLETSLDKVESDERSQVSVSRDTSVSLDRDDDEKADQPVKGKHAEKEDDKTSTPEETKEEVKDKHEDTDIEPTVLDDMILDEITEEGPMHFETILPSHEAVPENRLISPRNEPESPASSYSTTQLATQTYELARKLAP